MNLLSDEDIGKLQAENERLSAGWQKANQEALQAKLTVQEQAKDIVLLCDDLKYIAGIARRAGMPVDDDNLKVRAAILGAFQILEAERDQLQSKLGDAIRALLDRLEKAEKDAERYRWLRDTGTQGFSNGVPQRGVTIAMDGSVKLHFVYWMTQQQLDKSIDEAMEASK